MSPPEDAGLDALLDYLKRSRGFDFTGYKRSTLLRRIEKRLQAVGVERYGDYLEYLEVHPDEFSRLFTTILINVTAFFRDLPAWDFLAQEVVPHIVKAKGDLDPIRIWSAGCASGEEAFSLAIVLAEALGLPAFRERIKIYGTDVDDEALHQARQATYPARDLIGVPPALLDKYFELQGDRYVFHKELRRSVIFGRNDLIQDAPISRLDLLACRNTLMYFNAETQAHILNRFHFALNEGGYLFLGKAEMLLAHGAAFAPVDLKRRLFVKTPRVAVGNRAWVPFRGLNDASSGPANGHRRLHEAALDAAPAPQLVVDAGGALVFANREARQAFGLTPQDVGRPLQELEVSLRPVDLRPCIEQACRENQPVTLREVKWRGNGDDATYADVVVTPLPDGGAAAGATVVFTDVTRVRRLQEDLQRAARDLATAQEELQSTNEELETTNEELQSTVEELETTNEELQSTNEELETMNEELQSANEELQTINEEVRQRSEELNEVNVYLEAILTSLRAGVAVLDRELLVRIWSRRSEELWGLRAEEVRGKNFLNLDIGLPAEPLRQSIRACLTGEATYRESTLEAVNRRGHSIQCKVTCTPLISKTEGTRGAILLMEEQDGDGRAPPTTPVS